MNHELRHHVTAIFDAPPAQIGDIDPEIIGQSQLQGEQTRTFTISSTDTDFMIRNTDDLRDYLLGRVEAMLDPECDDAFMFVREAMRFAEDRHGRQKRFDGTLNINHIMRLGIRLLEDPHFMSDPTQLQIKLAAGVLHDVLEDTATDPHELEALFGQEVAAAVDALSRNIFLTGEYRPEEIYYPGIADSPEYVADIKGHDRVDNLDAITLIDFNMQEIDEIIFKGTDYLQKTKTFYPSLVSENPFLEKKLAHSFRSAEQRYHVNA